MACSRSFLVTWLWCSAERARLIVGACLRLMLRQDTKAL